MTTDQAPAAFGTCAPPVPTGWMRGLPATAQRESLSFTASGESGTGPLTWAQQHMLMLMELLSPGTESVNLWFWVSLRTGVTAGEVRQALQDLVAAHEALRTVYVPPPLGPAQHVYQTGELPLAVIEASEQTASELAGEAAQTLGAMPYDITSELAARIALINVDGQPRHLVLGFNHLFVDFEGSYWAQHHLRDILLPRAWRAGAAAAPHRPLSEAAWEASPVGLRTGERAVRHHEQTFEVMPQTMVPRLPGEAHSPRYQFLEFESPALKLAVPALASRHNTTAAVVLFAGISAMAGFVSGLDRSFLQLTAGNRIDRRARGAVSMFTQDVPASVDLAGLGIAEVIGKSVPAVLDAGRFARYPPEVLLERRRRIETRRGISFDMSCWLNCRLPARAQQEAGREPPSPQALAQAARAAAWRTVGGVESSTSTYFVFADDTGDSLTLTLLHDTAILPPAEGLAWLRALEKLLSGALAGDIAVAGIGEYTGLAPQSRDGDWHLTAGGWVCLPSATDLLSRAAGGAEAAVFPEPGGGGRLLGFVDGHQRGLGLSRLHDACMAALPGNRTAAAPHRYVVCGGAPRAGGLDAWQRLPVLQEGTGRD
jgi:condensation domain-containing protein